MCRCLWCLVLIFLIGCNEDTRPDPVGVVADWEKSSSEDLSSSSSVAHSSSSVAPSSSSVFLSSSSLVVIVSSSSSVVSSSSSSLVVVWCAIAGNCGTFTDSRDNHTYKWTRIGTQTWMAENLAYLPSVSTTVQSSDTTTYYYVYDYSGTSVASAKATSSYTTYGVLYNWPAALTACPSDWHLPSDDEWQTLLDYVGGDDIAGVKLKANSTLWYTNTSSDSYSFSALPGGGFVWSGFYYGGINGFWWSSTSNGDSDAYGRYMSYNYAAVFQNYYYRDIGYSVRCVQDDVD